MKKLIHAYVESFLFKIVPKLWDLLLWPYNVWFDSLLRFLIWIICVAEGGGRGGDVATMFGRRKRFSQKALLTPHIADCVGIILRGFFWWYIVSILAEKWSLLLGCCPWMVACANDAIESEKYIWWQLICNIVWISPCWGGFLTVIC